jgi:hypothetical protein
MNYKNFINSIARFSLIRLNPGKLSQVLWFIVLIGSFVTALAISWWFHYSQNFFYSFWYDIFEIHAHIERFGPRNWYTKGLDLLSKKDHEFLFHEISRAVHFHGEGLSDIHFIYNNIKQNLLRNPEIVHLRDVADLIDNLRSLILIVFTVSVSLLFILLKRGIYPVWKYQAGSLVSLTVFTAAVLLIAGPKKVVYQLHIWIFPANHKWLFYYEESLMSVLMKAPVIFGGIAASVIAGALIIYAGFLLLILYLQNRK